MLKILVAVCIYDRFENLKRWIHAWKLSDTTGAELVIVHNRDILIGKDPFQRYCRLHHIRYVKRPNVGFETGVIQDIFLERLKVRKWDAFLSVTDDTIPMNRDFLNHFRNALSPPDVGVACMNISGIWTPHIRTTGFCVKKEVTKNIHWVHDPVETKEQCYFFEHQGFEDTFMSQVLKMDKRVVQLSNIADSLLWDTDHNISLNRWAEWNKEFPGYNK